MVSCQMKSPKTRNEQPNVECRKPIARKQTKHQCCIVTYSLQSLDHLRTAGCQPKLGGMLQWHATKVCHSILLPLFCSECNSLSHHLKYSVSSKIMNAKQRQYASQSTYKVLNILYVYVYMCAIYISMYFNNMDSN